MPHTNIIPSSSVFARALTYRPVLIASWRRSDEIDNKMADPETMTPRQLENLMLSFLKVADQHIAAKNQKEGMFKRMGFAKMMKRR